jgi:hypothetical protein
MRVPADHVLVFLKAGNVVHQKGAHLLLDINFETDKFFLSLPQFALKESVDP